MPQPPAHIYPPHPHYISQHHTIMNIPVPPSILKKTSAYSASPSMPTLAPNKEPPGVPPFPPPELSSDDEDVENVCESVILSSLSCYKRKIILIFIKSAGKRSTNKIENDKIR